MKITREADYALRIIAMLGLMKTDRLRQKRLPKKTIFRIGLL